MLVLPLYHVNSTMSTFNEYDPCAPPDPPCRTPRQRKTLKNPRFASLAAWLYLPLIVPIAHVLLSPYTKVEESFTLHAVHDVLAHGSDVAKWDHVQFPGAVPRSFLPPIALAAVVWPFSKLLTSLGLITTRLGTQRLGMSSRGGGADRSPHRAGARARRELWASAH